MRDKLTTLIEVVGGAAVTAGVGFIYAPAALICGGLALLGVGYLEGRKSEPVA